MDGDGIGSRVDEGAHKVEGGTGIGGVEKTDFGRDGFGDVAAEGGKDVACSFGVG